MGAFTIGLIIVALLSWAVKVYQPVTCKSTGWIVFKQYETVHDRFYFVIRIDCLDTFRDYVEYTVDLDTFNEYSVDDLLECEVEFNQLNARIKSIRKIK